MRRRKRRLQVRGRRLLSSSFVHWFLSLRPSLDDLTFRAFVVLVEGWAWKGVKTERESVRRRRRRWKDEGRGRRRCSLPRCRSIVFSLSSGGQVPPSISHFPSLSATSSTLSISSEQHQQQTWMPSSCSPFRSCLFSFLMRWSFGFAVAVRLMLLLSPRPAASVRSSLLLFSAL